MQTLEAMLSLVFFIWAATLAMSAYDIQPHDDSLYRLQLAGDAWRVMYLRGELRNVSNIRYLDPSLRKLGDETGLCFFVNGIRNATNCPGGNRGHDMIISLPRTIIVSGVPQSVTFSVGK